MKKLTLLIGLIAFCGLGIVNGQWSTSGSNIYNTNSGNVGIGTSSPGYLLHAAKNMTSPSIRIQNLGGTGGAAFEMIDNLSNADWKFKATTTGGFKIRDHANGLDVIIVEPNSAANTIYIDENGNVGIGTNTPDKKLDISGDARIHGITAGMGTGNNSYLNTAFGYYSLGANTSGIYNSAFGYSALQYNSTGNANTSYGYYSMNSNTSGSYNTALGSAALQNNSDGSSNIAIGSGALSTNDTGNSNVGIGRRALTNNINRSMLIAIGDSALFNNGTGVSQDFHATKNLAVGFKALYTNTIGWYNVAIGLQSLYTNDSGNDNTSVGVISQYNNSTGDFNSSLGVAALHSNTTGSDNTAIGYKAGYGSTGVNFNQCTFIGSDSYPTVSRTNVTMLGYNIANAQCTGSDQVLLGNTSVMQIRAAVSSITTYSDGRYKTNVRNDVHGLDFVMKLNPVTYNVRPSELHRIWNTPDSILSRMDNSSAEQVRFIGFVAQDVEKAARESGFEFPGIDVPRNENEVYTMRYGDFIMPMVKAIQEQQAEIEQLNSRILELEDKLAKVLSDSR